MIITKSREGLFILTIVLTLISCQEFNNQDVLGKWEVASVTLDEVSLASSQEQDLKAELKSMVFYFKDDGLILYSNFYRSGAHGQWKLRTEKNLLECTYMFERITYSDTYTLEQKEDKLILYSDNFEGVNSIELILIRST